MRRAWTYVCSEDIVMESGLKRYGINSRAIGDRREEKLRVSWREKIVI